MPRAYVRLWSTAVRFRFDRGFPPGGRQTALVQCAWAATRTKGCYLQAQFLRLRSRRGAKKAICAVAASLLTSIYHMLKNGVPYKDLAAAHFDRISRQRKVNTIVRRLRNMGYAVKIESLAV